jgi:hypothetical protein
MTYDFAIAGQAPDADGTEGYLGILMLAGASRGAAVAKVGRPTFPGRVSALPVADGTTISHAAGHFGPLLYSASSGAVAWRIPLMCQLAMAGGGTGFTRTPGTTQELALFYQRQFLGALAINQAQYRGSVADNTGMTGLSTAVTGDWCQKRDVSGGGSRGGTPYVLTGSTYSTLGHWTAIPIGQANRPNVDWGAVANQAGMTGLSNAIVGDWCSRSDASNAIYMLVTAGPGTAGNWLLRSDMTTSNSPQIKVNWNNLDPSSLAMQHPPGCLFSSGVGNDEYTAC